MKQNAIFLISRIRESANRLIMNELAKLGFSELSPSHGDILAALYAQNSLPMQEIAKKIHRTKATTTVLVDKLEKFGLVKREKSNEDSRRIRVLLTRAGMAFKDEFKRFSEDLNTKVYKNLTTAEALTFESLLEKVRDNLE